MSMYVHAVFMYINWMNKARSPFLTLQLALVYFCMVADVFEADTPMNIYSDKISVL